MPAIFISHSSLDPKEADEIKSSLAHLGFERVFLDFDKTTGVDAGENWEKRLYEELSRCHAVILVLTPNWMQPTSGSSDSGWAKRKPRACAAGMSLCTFAPLRLLRIAFVGAEAEREM